MFHGYSGFVKKQTNFDEVPYFEDEEHRAAFPSGKCFTAQDVSTSGAGAIFKGRGCPGISAFMRMGVTPEGERALPLSVFSGSSLAPPVPRS